MIPPNEEFYSKHNFTYQTPKPEAKQKSKPQPITLTPVPDPQAKTALTKVTAFNRYLTGKL